MNESIGDVIVDINGNPIKFEGHIMTSRDLKDGLGRTDRPFIQWMDSVINDKKVQKGELPHDWDKQREEYAIELFKKNKEKQGTMSTIQLSDKQKAEAKKFVDNTKVDVNFINQNVKDIAIESFGNLMSPAVAPTVPTVASVPNSSLSTNTGSSVSHYTSLPITVKNKIPNNTLYVNSKGGDKDMNFIQHVNIKCNREDLITALGGYISDENYALEEKPTRQGKTMLVFTEKDLNNNVICTLIMNYELKGEKVEIVPFKLDSRNYLTGLSLGLHESLCFLANTNGGDYIGCVGTCKYMTIQGEYKPADIKIVEQGTLVAFDTPTETKLGSTIKKTLKEYLSEDKNLANMIKYLSFPENLNTMGKYLIQRKLDDKIASDDFICLFRQIGMMGATDPTVLKFYSILK